MIGFVPLPDFYKEPSLRVVEQITESTKGFTAEGHFGTWHSIQMQEFHNEKFFRCGMMNLENRLQILS